MEQIISLNSEFVSLFIEWENTQEYYSMYTELWRSNEITQVKYSMNYSDLEPYKYIVIIIIF